MERKKEEKKSTKVCVYIADDGMGLAVQIIISMLRIL